ncbi:glycosyltransferase [Ramlibacter tataouinensis]|nr:glycosyltransferase [Ramlibacter tataouinensis]
MLVITKGETGGAQTHVLALCQALAGRADINVVIGGTSADSPLARALRQAGVPTRTLPALRNSLSPWAVARATRDLLRLLRERPPDLLHAHSAVAGVVARLAGWIARVPVVYTVHGFGFKPQAPALQRRMAFLAEWTLAPLTRRMVCVSHHERALAARLPLPAQRVSVIPNAVVDTPHRASPAREPARIVMVARFAAPKRPDLLLRAAALLRDQQRHEALLTLIGDGPELVKCQALAREFGLAAARFPGDVSDVPERLAQHEVFVLLSDHEGLPISVLEAMRSGLAIVASDLPGIRELVRTGQEALLVPNDPAAVAQALARLAASPELRSRLGQGARRRYETLFTPGTMVDAVLNLYGQIAAHEP